MPGEYNQPQQRVAWASLPAVSGYTAGRWTVRNAKAITPSGYAIDVLLDNMGDQQVTLQFKQADMVISGARSNLGSAFTVVAGGRKAVQIIPSKRVLELACTSGTSNLKLQMESLVNWSPNVMHKSEPLYASSLNTGPDGAISEALNLHIGVTDSVGISNNLPSYTNTAALRAAAVPSGSVIAITQGAVTAGDGLGKTWYWSAASVVVDDGSATPLAINPTANGSNPGRWLPLS